MSVRVEHVTADARAFSLTDYISPHAANTDRKATNMTFDLSGALATPTSEGRKPTQITFKLESLKTKPAQKPPEPLQAPSHKLSAGLLSGGGGDSAELVRLRALLEEGRLNQKKLEKKLDQAEQNVLRANKAIEAERKAHHARVAQVTSELNASRNLEAKARAEMENSPALVAARAQAQSFKMQAEGAVLLEAEFSETREALASVQAERDAVSGELETLRGENDGLSKEVERLTQLLSKARSDGDLTEGAVDAVSAELAALHQKEVDDLSAAIETEKQHRAVAEAIIPEIQAQLGASEEARAHAESRATDTEAKFEEARESAATSEARASEALQKATAAEAVAAQLATKAQEAEARAVAAEEAAAERIESFKKQLPTSSQESLDSYAAKVALAKSTRGRDRHFAAQEAAESLHELTTGRAVSKVYHTSNRVAPRRSTGLALTLPDGLPRTATLAGNHPQLHTGEQSPTSVLELPKASQEDRVARAVASIRTDLVQALKERKSQYASAA